MSDSAITGLILALLIGGQFSFFMSLAKLKQWVDEIATGLIGGHRVSVRHRWSVLWTTWMPLNFFVGIYGFLLAAGIGLLARGIGNEQLRWLGYLIALFSGMSFVGLIGLGTILFFYLSSVLRHAEAD